MGYHKFKEWCRKTNFVEKKDEISLLMACHAIRKITKILWYLDTEYSNYMNVDKLIFSKLDESYQDFVPLLGCYFIYSLVDKKMYPYCKVWASLWQTIYSGKTITLKKELEKEGKS